LGEATCLLDRHVADDFRGDAVGRLAYAMQLLENFD
jgi:hypothetical protein